MKARLTPADFAADRRRAEIREKYDQGWSMHALKRVFNLSKSEAEDIMPEEYDFIPTPDGNAGY